MCAGEKVCNSDTCNEAPKCQEFDKCDKGTCLYKQIICLEGEVCDPAGAGICASPKFCCNMFCRLSIVECYGSWPAVSSPAIAQRYPLPLVVRLASVIHAPIPSPHVV
jgi:hypothetical protein